MRFVEASGTRCGSGNSRPTRIRRQGGPLARGAQRRGRRRDHRAGRNAHRVRRRHDGPQPRRGFWEFVAYLDSRVSIVVLGQTLPPEHGAADRRHSATSAGRFARNRGVGRASSPACCGATSSFPVVSLNHGMRQSYARGVIERGRARRHKAVGARCSRNCGMGLRVRRPDAHRAARRRDR